MLRGVWGRSRFPLEGPHPGVGPLNLASWAKWGGQSGEQGKGPARFGGTRQQADGGGFRQRVMHWPRKLGSGGGGGGGCRTPRTFALHPKLAGGSHRSRLKDRRGAAICSAPWLRFGDKQALPGPSLRRG